MPMVPETEDVADAGPKSHSTVSDAEPATPERLPTSTLPRAVGARYAACRQLMLHLLLLATIGAAVGGTAYLLYAGDVTALGRDNRVGRRERSWLLLSMALGGFLSAWVVTILALIRRRTKAQRATLILRVARIASPLCFCFPLLFLFDWRTWEGREMPLAAVAIMVGLLLERAFRISFATAAPRLRRVRVIAHFTRQEWLPVALLALAVGTVAAYFAYFTIINHYRLQTSSYDLAIFDNMMWNLLHGAGFKASPEVGREGSHLAIHANFLAIAFLPLYALKPGPEALLVIQALVVSTAAIPLYRLANRRLGSRWAALAISAAYLLFAPIHSAVFYDFHFLTLAPFFVFWVLHLFEAGSKTLLIVAFVAALLLREDQGAVLAAAALFYLLEGRRPLWAMLGGIVASAYAAVTKLVLMPVFFGHGEESFTWMYGGMIGPGEKGLVAVLRTIASNPLYVLGMLTDSGRVLYLLKIFGPVLFIALRHKFTWILFLPAALFTVLSTHSPLYEPYFQYVCNWASVMFFATIVAIDHQKPKAPKASPMTSSVVALLLASIVFSFNFGGLLQRNTLRGGFRKVVFAFSEADRERLNQLRSIIKNIPPSASVAATETEAPHVSKREDCFTLRYRHGDAQYILTNRETLYGSSNDNFRSAMDTGKYRLIAMEGPFSLWWDGSPAKPDSTKDPLPAP